MTTSQWLDYGQLWEDDLSLSFYSLAFSVLAHLLIAILWRLSTDFNRPSLTPQKIIEIEYLKTHEEPLSNLRPTEANVVAGNSRRKSRTLSLGELKPHGSTFRPEINQFREGASTESAGPRGPKNPEEWGYGSSAGQLLEQLENFQKFEKLYEKVEGILNYPAALADRGHEAVLNFRMIMNKNGCMSEPKWKHQSDPYLMVYVRKLFERKVCKSEFLNQVLSAEALPIDFSFTFQLVEGTSSAAGRSPGRGVRGNFLVFYRSYPKSKLEWRLGPLRGLWGIPTVSLDFVWLYENWQRWQSDIDPLDEFR